MKTSALVGLAGLAALSMVSATASAHNVVRFEPAPVYGAVAEMQSGVRIIRALPSSRQIIVNPSVTTPLTIKIGPHCEKASCRK